VTLVAESLPAVETLEDRLIVATLSCIARWGLAKTTVDDVAREAQCSRATVYRVFPGGKETLVAAVARSEVARVCNAILHCIHGSTTIGDALTAALAEASRQVVGHSGVAFLISNEPETIVPWLAFGGKEQVLAYATAVVAPALARFLSPPQSRRAAEWAVRVLFAFVVCPAPGVDLTDDASARALVTTFLLPGL
jgi:AcrR family transcriptional regulator